MSQELYTTGKFAELCGVKKQTLFHYDDIGLLKPSHVDDNGYRKYSPDQYQTFMLITCLKEAGMSLAEIKDYLNCEDPLKRDTAVKARLAALDQRIEYLMQVRKILTSSFTSEGYVFGNDANNDDLIALVDLNEENYYALGPLDAMDDKTLIESVAELVKHVEPDSICLSSDDVMRGILDVQKYLLVKPSTKLTANLVTKLKLVPFTRPAGRYGITEQQPGETVEDAYLRLTDTFIQFDEDPGEFFYETYTFAANEESASPVKLTVQLLPMASID